MHRANLGQETKEHVGRAATSNLLLAVLVARPNRFDVRGQGSKVVVGILVTPGTVLRGFAGGAKPMAQFSL